MRLITEGYDGQIITKESAWPKVYAAFQNRTVIQVEAKGAKVYNLDNREIPCLQVQIGSVVGIIPAHEAGLNNIPESIDDLNNLSPKEKKAVVRRLENRLVGLPVWLLILAVDRKNERFLASRRRALEIMAPGHGSALKKGPSFPAR